MDLQEEEKVLIFQEEKQEEKQEEATLPKEPDKSEVLPAALYMY